MSLDLTQSRSLLMQSAALRGRARFGEAIVLLETAYPEFHEFLRENALLEIIYAAQEGGMTEKARATAVELAKLDPDIPTVRRILSAAS